MLVEDRVHIIRLYFRWFIEQLSSLDRTLADMNGDGKMDKLEFSVAMHLIKKKLQGYELPKVLPASLKAAPSPVIGSFGMQAGPMPMGQPVVMGIAPAMNPPMGE